jgi:dephospho-CoA kinase
MKNLALTGNIASGKSTVAELFRRWGATIIDADELAREAQRPGSPVLGAIARRFGPEMLLSSGELDRPRLRARVMADAGERHALNAIVHPEVTRRRDLAIAEARAAGARVVINVIPLLFETLDPAAFDGVILVDAPEPLRLARLMSTRGLTREDALAMIRSQLPAETKRARCEYIIENAGRPEDLERSARRVWEELDTRC